MSIVQLMTTVLPHSVDPAAEFHVSLFFTHRAQPDPSDPTLAAVPALTNWPAALRSASIELTVNGQLGSPSLVLDEPTPVTCQPLTAPLSDAAWTAACPGKTRVTRFAAQIGVADADWRSYPASAMPEHAVQAHYASVFSSPVTPPSVRESRLAAAVLGYLRDSRDEAITKVVRDLDTCQADRDAHRDRVREQRRRDAIDTRYACDCNDHYDEDKQVDTDGFCPDHDDSDQEDTNPPEPKPKLDINAPDSPVQRLLDHDDTSGSPSRIAAFDNAVTKLLDDLVHPPPPPSQPHPGGPIVHLTAGSLPHPAEPILRDAHATQLYYNRAEEQTKPQPDPDPNAQRPRPADLEPDFHALAAAAGNVPALARQLGFVLDLKIASPQLLPARGTISCQVTVPGVQTLPSPVTHYVIKGTHFLADVAGSSRWDDGYLTIGTPEYRVLDLDPDASGLKLEQHLRGAVRALASELNGDPENYAPGTLRATGFAIAHTNRTDSVRQRVSKAEQHNDAVDGGSAPAVDLHYGEVVRGLRVEVWDDVTGRWHSLHERLVDVEINGVPLLPSVPDTGLLQNAALTRASDNPDHPYNLHEVVAGWDGWSLSAPRPGRTVTHDSGQGNPQLSEPGAEMIDADRESRPGAFTVSSTAAAASLPALRYGRRYAFRVLGVDLAGNSVVRDMETGQPDSLDQAALDIATRHLDGLRAQAAERGEQGLLERLRVTAASPTELPGLVGRVRNAMAAVERVAKNLITRPQLDTTAAEFGTLYARSGSPDTVTTPRPFLRWDPVPEPTVVPRMPYTTGESSHRVVIRTTEAGSGRSERHLLPPKTSQLEAELDGRFDELMRSTDPAARRRAYAIALKERGTLYHTAIPDLNNPTRLVQQPDVHLETGLTVDKKHAVTKEFLQQSPENQPAAGQYIRHDTDQLVLPYLPDPMARGIALVFYEAGADHHLADRRVLQSVVLPYSGSWPMIEGLRLVLESGPELVAVRDGNQVRVALPPGEQVGIAVSSTLDSEHLAKLGLWRHHAVHDPAVSEADRKVLEQAALDGWLWWLTPSTDLRLVNATPGPAKPPMITTLTSPPRIAYSVTAELRGTLDVHGASTDGVELRAMWDDIVDDPAGLPTRVHHEAVVSKLAIGANETTSVLTTMKPDEPPRSSEVPERPVVHTLPDGSYRSVDYQLHGTSRYREFFDRTELPGPDDLTTAGNVVRVRHLNSVPPPPPVVHDVMPIFFWEEHHEPNHPFASRRIRRSGVRIWLERPWYVSGEDEMLGIVTATDPVPSDKEQWKALLDQTSAWGRDPTRYGPALLAATELPEVPRWEQRLLSLGVDPRQRPGHPHDRVPLRAGDQNFQIYLYRPEFHAERRRWFVDVRLDAAEAAWPFVRLNVLRYQPNSIGRDFTRSTDVNTDFVQLPSERIATLSRPDADSVRVTISGAFSTDLSVNDANAAHPGDPAAAALAIVRANRTVRATLQLKGPKGSDLGWRDAGQVECDVEGVDPKKFLATWSGALPLHGPARLTSPDGDQRERVLVEELEHFPTDPEPGVEGSERISRLVYADHLYL
jgi:hypothetical protein